MAADDEIIIAGAGPTGLIMALTLARLGVSFRIIDPKPGPADESRALGIQARTLEFYTMLGIAEKIVKSGICVDTVHLVDEGREKTRFSLTRMGEGLSPFPYLLVLAQDAHERLLIEALREKGHQVEWNTRLDSLEQDGGTVRALLIRGEDRETVVCGWLIGCDGAHSTVRKSLDIGFPGGTNEGLFFVADVVTDMPSEDVFAAFTEETVCLMFPVRREAGEQRLIGVVPPGVAAQPELDFEGIRPLPERTLGIKVKELNWFSTYHVSHRVAETFRKGRCFLAGDAGHVHSPVGGQGMNTGIGDAFNLAWKLAAAIRKEAPQEILDSYEPERIAFAKTLVATTDRAFGPLVRRSGWSKMLRSLVLPNALRILTRAPRLPEMIFRTISQTRITYRDSPMSEGSAGAIEGGDRIPWVDMLDNFNPLKEFCWQLHIYGEQNAELVAGARARSIKTCVFPYHEDAGTAGLRRDAAYLLRPDGHVGIVLPDQDAAALSDYLDRHGLRFSPGGSR